MNKIVYKIKHSIKTIGIGRTIVKLVKHLTNKIYKDKTMKIKVFQSSDIEERFTIIYQNNLWGNFESASGNGSTLEGTENLRNLLPKIISQYSIKTIFDAPCGDFNWMKMFLKTNKIDYVGGDIVLPLIESHVVNYSNEKTNFIHIDLIKEIYPTADLMICRDCLFHLSYKDTRSVIQNFIKSNIPYLLTTTYINNDTFDNFDIETADFRFIDLFSIPYNFDKNVLFRINDSIQNEPPREMCLWSRDQLISAVERFNY